MTGDGEATTDTARKGDSPPVMGVTHWPVSHRTFRGNHRGVQSRAQACAGRYLLRVHPRHVEEQLPESRQPISLIALVNSSEGILPPRIGFEAAIETFILLGAL